MKSLNGARALEANSQPRNIWLKLYHISIHLYSGDCYRARKLLDGIRHHPDISVDCLKAFYKEIALVERRLGTHDSISLPEDFGGANSDCISQLRQLSLKQKHPHPYPWEMSLPPIIGSVNDYRFLLEASYKAAPRINRNIKGVHIICSFNSMHTDNRASAFLRSSDFKNAYQIPVKVTVFDNAVDTGITKLNDASLEVRNDHLFRQENNYIFSNDYSSSEVVIFVDGQMTLNNHALDRILLLLNTSKKAFVLLNAVESDAAIMSLYCDQAPQEMLNSQYPYREIQGFNFAIRAESLRQLGMFNFRFKSEAMAAKELAFRAFNHGFWLVPIGCSASSYRQNSPITESDSNLFTNLCPNHLDRTSNQKFEVPKICIYIPAFNAAKYIERAIDSVLRQDVADLEICVFDDGSKDLTSQIVREKYAAYSQVRLLTGPNGGIGFASNQAINYSNSQYIGQLDSDDQLKPGSIKILSDYLDENPTIACVYSSCERIDECGNYLQAEYSWPNFTREKMMVTSIVHHFRMFRRSAFERTVGFREDIINAIDYDMFLKISEVGRLKHIDKILYQRRWHEENTSKIYETHQTSNTYCVQLEALQRLGLKHWEIYNVDASRPRLVSYRLKDDVNYVVFYPDYSRSNKYQRLLYNQAHKSNEIVGGDIDCALRVLDSGMVQNGKVIFHLHWLNSIFLSAETESEAADAGKAFLNKLEKFVSKGGKLIWTIHNTLSHDKKFGDVEVDVSNNLTSLASTLHFHSSYSVDEVKLHFNVPNKKVSISRHGNYIDAYPNYVTRELARKALGIELNEDVILFTGQIRPYKGVENLLAAFRTILQERPSVRLVLAGKPWFDIYEAAIPCLSEFETAQITLIDRFIKDSELQILFNAADFSVYPYKNILTSGSLLLSLSFGVPAIVPRVGMTQEVCEMGDAGLLYEIDSGAAGITEAMRRMLGRKADGQLPLMRSAARSVAESLSWPDFSNVIQSASGS